MLHLERLTSTAHPEYCKAMDLYQESFPLHEQRRAASQERILADGDYCFGLVRDGGRLVGLVLFWENGRFVYIEHLCVFPDMRNQQYGQKILSLLKEREKSSSWRLIRHWMTSLNAEKGFTSVAALWKTLIAIFTRPIIRRIADTNLW